MDPIRIPILIAKIIGLTFAVFAVFVCTLLSFKVASGLSQVWGESSDWIRIPLMLALLSPPFIYVLIAQRHKSLRRLDLFLWICGLLVGAGSLLLWLISDPALMLHQAVGKYAGSDPVRWVSSSEVVAGGVLATALFLVGGFAAFLVHLAGRTEKP